jgi:protein-disulfide isomerase
MTRFKALLAALVLGAAPASAEVRLLMVEEPGCLYCARWFAEVGDAYAVTAEGRIAPLLRAQLRETLPAGVALVRPALFTPTFVLLNGGAEVGRIEGYPGEDFFWPLLGQLIGQLPADLQKDPGS